VIVKFYTKTLKIVNGKLTISDLFFFDEIQSFEEDEVAEKGFRVEPLRHLTMGLNNLFDKLKNCVIKLKFNKF